MKVGDIGTELTYIAKDQNGNIIDLSLIDSAILTLYLNGNKIPQNCTFGDKTKGEINYILADGDLPTSGSLEMQIKLVFLDGDTYTSNILRDEVEPVL